MDIAWTMQKEETNPLVCFVLIDCTDHRAFNISLLKKKKEKKRNRILPKQLFQTGNDIQTNILTNCTTISQEWYWTSKAKDDKSSAIRLKDTEILETPSGDFRSFLIMKEYTNKVRNSIQVLGRKTNNKGESQQNGWENTQTKDSNMDEKRASWEENWVRKLRMGGNVGYVKLNESN